LTLQESADRRNFSEQLQNRILARFFTPSSSVMVEENTLQQIWRLTNELALQQSANKEAINGITQQMSDVKVSKLRFREWIQSLI
jgi:hypothetical protein